MREVAPRADPVTGTFRVRVGLIDPPAEMRLGSTVTGRPPSAARAGIELPGERADQRRRASPPSGWSIRRPDTVALRHDRRRSVSPRHPSSCRDGLALGEIVVTAGVQALRPGQEVRLLGGAS